MTDHRHEALSKLATVEEIVASAKEAGDIRIDVLQAINGNIAREVAIAQVHATLALTEQQRIANLLTFHDLSQRQSQSHIGEKERARVERVAAQIREGLWIS